MKVFVIFLVLVGCIAFVPHIFGAQQNLFEGNSSFERLPDTITPNTVYEFELKLQITDSPYWLHELSPVVDISPKTDANNVHINFEKIPSGFFAIHRVPVTLYVDQNISSEKIFLNVSFVSENSSGDELRSSWSESLVLNVESTQSNDKNYRFIDFSYANIVGEPIKFILEKMADDNCNSYNAEIIDEEGNFVLGWGAEISCDPDWASSSTPVQTKIGYKESHPIIINDSGKYYLKLEFDDVSITKEFVVRQNHTGISLDPKIYSVPWAISPLKQFNSGSDIDEIQCKQNLVLVQKYDRTPACVKPETVPKIFERNWLPSQKLWNEVKHQDVFPNAEDFSQIVRTKTDTVQEATELVDFNIMAPSYLPPNYEIKSVIVLSSDAVMGFAGTEEISNKINPSDYLWNGGVMFYQTHKSTANERFTDLQDRMEHITTPHALGNASAFVNWHYIQYDGNELIAMMPKLWTINGDTYTEINGNVSEQQIVAMAGSMYDCFSDCVTESTKTKLIERGWTTQDSQITKTTTPYCRSPLYVLDSDSNTCITNEALPKCTDHTTNDYAIQYCRISVTYNKEFDPDTMGSDVSLLPKCKPLRNCPDGFLVATFPLNGDDALCEREDRIIHSGVYYPYEKRMLTTSGINSDQNEIPSETINLNGSEEQRTIQISVLTSGWYEKLGHPTVVVESNGNPLEQFALDLQKTEPGQTIHGLEYVLSEDLPAGTITIHIDMPGYDLLPPQSFTVKHLSE